jgi:hypothetical protein
LREALRAVFLVLRAAFTDLRPRPPFRFPAFFLPRALRFFAITLPLVAPYPYRKRCDIQHEIARRP